MISMSSHKQADHRLVQPKPEHYVTNEKGEPILVGIYTNAQRNRYMQIQTSLYMTRHPNATQQKARRASFQKWRNMVFATLDEQHKQSVEKK